MRFPEELRYAETHEWVRKENGEAVVGISDFAQDALGDVVFVELPQEGVTFQAGDVIAINNCLEENPEWVNEDPYGQGWLIRVQPSNPEELDQLESAQSYQKGLEKAD